MAVTNTGTTMWPDPRLLDFFHIEHPIIQAPMANSLGRGTRRRGSPSRRARLIARRDDRCREVSRAYRRVPRRAGQAGQRQFFTHRQPTPNNAREAAWREALKPYYAEYGIDPGAPVASASRAPFNAALCEVVETLKPEVVSFHYGLPAADLLTRVKAAGCKVMCSATTVAEAKHLAANGCDAISHRATKRAAIAACS